MPAIGVKTLKENNPIFTKSERSVHIVLEDFVEQDQSALDNFHWRHHTEGSEVFLQYLLSQQHIT